MLLWNRISDKYQNELRPSIPTVPPPRSGNGLLSMGISPLLPRRLARYFPAWSAWVCIRPVFNLRAKRVALVPRPVCSFISYSQTQVPTIMRSTGPYSRDLMTRVLEGRKQPVYPLPDEDPAPSWEEQVCGPSHIFTDASSILSKVVNACVHPLIPVASSFLKLSLGSTERLLGGSPLDTHRLHHTLIGSCLQDSPYLCNLSVVYGMSHHITEQDSTDCSSARHLRPLWISRR